MNLFFKMNHHTQKNIISIVYVLVFLGVIYIGPLALGIFFAIISLLGVKEVHKLSSEQSNKFLAYLGTIILILALAVFKLDLVSIETIALLLPIFWLALMSFSVFMDNKNPLNLAATSITAAIYLPLFLFLTMESAYTSGSWEPGYLLGFLLTIWLYDKSAYLIGAAMGRTPFVPEISPNKTWEGLAGGSLVAMVVALLFAYFSDLQNLGFWGGAWFFICIFGTIGDLFESKLKRVSGVKDSGNILPGHGGILDRFDSILFSGPVFTGYIYLIQVLF